MKLNNELHSVDRFTIHIPFPLSSYERKLITLLYQPLIGPEPISLYFLLWAEGEDEEGRDYTHYHLMNGLDMSIGAIFNARIALEAIGLLRTYKKETDDLHYFSYEILPPLEARRFFEDPLLSMFLFSKIGENAYRRLLQRFTPKRVAIEGMTEISRQFTDVYQPIQQHMPKNMMVHDIAEKPSKIPFYYQSFDFPLLMSGLSENMIPHRLITAEIKETIAKVAFMYGLSAIDMKHVLMMANSDDELTTDAVRKSASEYYKLTISKTPPAISKMLPPEQAHEQAKEWNSKQDELVQYFEQARPIDVLIAVNDGKQVFDHELEMYESLITQYDITPPVVNVLIHYISLNNPGHISKKYIQAIAADWRKKGIETATQAMNEARQFMDQKNPTVKKATTIEDMHAEFELLQAAAYVLYQFEPGKASAAKLKNIEETFKSLMKKIEPPVLLQMLADGKEPFAHELKAVTQFASMYEWERPLLNTLIHYAHFSSEGNLNLPFLEAIASGWRKQSIQTIETAIQYGQNYRKSRAQKYSRTTYGNPEKKELPAWINSSEKPKSQASLEELERQYRMKKKS